MSGLGNDEDREKAARDASLDIAIGDADIADNLLGPVSVSGSPLENLIGSLNLELKALGSGGEARNSTLAVRYDYRKAVRSVLEDDPVRFSGFKAGFAASGNVAFRPGGNPRDFLDTAFSLGYFSSWGGAMTLDASSADFLNQLEDEIAAVRDVDKLMADDSWLEFKDFLGSRLSDQYYLGAGLEAGLESDQRFKTKQFTFGMDLGLVPRGWGSDSFLGKINVFDYVPAFLRVLSGQDSRWSPRGSGFPTFNMGLKRVMPRDNGLRAGAGDKSDFWRYDIEISFGSSLGRWRGGHVVWENNFRYYAEIGSSETVRREGLDDHIYFVTAITIPNGMFISYSTGRLPLDAKSDQVYELGFSYRF